MEKAHRTLIIIGGKEDRGADKVILGEVARRVGAGKLVISTAATSNKPEELFEEYEKAFRSLGVRHVFNLEIRDRGDATRERVSASYPPITQIDEGVCVICGGQNRWIWAAKVV